MVKIPKRLSEDDQSNITFNQTDDGRDCTKSETSYFNCSDRELGTESDLNTDDLKVEKNLSPQSSYTNLYLNVNGENQKFYASSIMNNSKAETRLCQLSENGNSSSSPHLNLKSNSRQDMSIERGRFSSKMSVKRRESLQVYSKRFPQQKKPKSFLMPRTKSLSKNSPIIRRCSLQEDQSILVFQVNYIL